MPTASASVRTIYPTPQLTETSVVEFTPPDTTTTTETGEIPPPPVDMTGKPYVAIIMTNLGLSALTTDRAINDLPAEIALAFSPYAPNVERSIKKAAAKDRETLLLLPMEPITYPKDDPGPRALSPRLGDDENLANLTWIMEKGPDSFGVMNFMGSRFMANKRNMEVLFSNLKQKQNLLFVETPANASSKASETAAEMGIRYVQATRMIDAVATDSHIRLQLFELEKEAKMKGYAIGIAESYPVTFTMLKAWADDLGNRGITLVPLSQMWKDKIHHDGRR